MDLNLLIGNAEADAVKKIEAAHLEARVTQRDGEAIDGILNMSRNRVNLEIENGIVTNAYIA